MVDLLLENFRAIMMGGILVVIGVSQFSRLVGSALGLVFVGLLAFLGSQLYARGFGVGLAVFPISQGAFYGLCALLAVFNLVGLRLAIATRARRARFARERALMESEDSDPA